MPKKLGPAQKRDCQVLLRLTGEELDWLESAAHLERTTVSTYVYSLVQNHLTGVRRNEHIRVDRENRRSYDQAVASTHPLRPDFHLGGTEVEAVGDTSSDRSP